MWREATHVYVARSARFGPKCLRVSTTEIWGQVVLCPGGCPAHRKVLGSIPDLHPLDAMTLFLQGS